MNWKSARGAGRGRRRVCSSFITVPSFPQHGTLCRNSARFDLNEGTYATQLKEDRNLLLQKRALGWCDFDILRSRDT
jgi:hypothetical protein